MNDLASADPNIQSGLLEAVSEGVAGGLLVYDNHDRIVFASRQLLQYFAVPEEFLAPRTRLRDFLRCVYDGGSRFAPEAPDARKPLGKEDWVAEQIASLWKERVETVERHADRWLSFSKRRLSSGYGVCVVRDVSDNKKREDRWRSDMERVQITEEVLDELPFPVTVKDSDLTYVAVNKRAAEFLDLTPEEILGRKAGDIHSLELAGHINIYDTQVLQSGEAVQMPELLTRPSGMEVSIFSNRYRIGKPGRYYVVTALEDVSGMVASGGQTEEPGSDPARKDIIPFPLPARKIAAMPSREGGRLFTASEPRGKLVVYTEGDAQDDALAKAILDEMNVETAFLSGEPLDLFLDLARDAGVRVDAVLVVGTEAELPVLDAAQRHGLPLMLVGPDRLCEDIAAGLADVLGSVEEGEEAGAEILPFPQESTLDVLVAEDNEVNQIVFSRILESLGYRYAIATDGEEAVRMWQEHLPRLVLMDVTLPKLTGFQASARIRMIETLETSVPIIGVLAQPFDNDRDDCYACGMNDVILKPISPEALQAVFDTYLQSALPRQFYA